MIKQFFTKIKHSFSKFLELELVALSLYMGFFATINFLNLINIFSPLIRLLISLFAFFVIIFLYSRFRDFIVDYFEAQMASTTATRLGIVIRVVLTLTLILSVFICWHFAPILFILLFILPFLPFLVDKEEEDIF